MKGTAKTKVVTSGRLSGRVKVQSVKRRIPPNPAPSACPEPAYSLYSTDSEDQVTALHKGLDRCAALLGGILQVDKSEASPSVASKNPATKSKPSTSVGKKIMKKLPPQTDQKIRRSIQRGSGTKTPKTPRQPVSVPAAHSGVKLHPPQRRPHTPQHLPSSSSSPHLHPQPPKTPQPDAEECVPVRDTDPQISEPLTSLTNAHTCTPEVPLEHAQEEEQRTAQDLLGELRALIAGQGSVAERLLGHLEQTLSSSSSSLLIEAGDAQAKAGVSSLRSQNTQLHRRVRSLQQQLKQREEAERRQNTQTFSTSEVCLLQDELTAAQSQLQDLQCDLTELREALQDTQSRLRESEAEKRLLQTDLETTKSRLKESERERSELASVAQRRLEEIQNLSETLRGDPSNHPEVTDSQIPKQKKPDPAEPPSDRITQYLMSLGEVGGAHTHPAEREGETSLPAASSSAPQLMNHRRQLFNSSLSHCDRISLSSDWSVRSGSTFDTRDEAAFRDGLAALDASIASLQKTIQLDLRR
ncbi:uncharacterized protein ccdc14 isoform X2 [Halichoeres trimaculatus]|uniref:uncharacterized protein ccdc14 isoform X2 n=1 Tax=Halichoeres trimaculatus TaxID=147232 RepID=UPI003D9F0A31